MDFDATARDKLQRVLEETGVEQGLRIPAGPPPPQPITNGNNGGTNGSGMSDSTGNGFDFSAEKGDVRYGEDKTNEFEGHSGRQGDGVGDMFADPDDPSTDKQVLSEIEKFRLRQQQRDK